MKNKLVQKYLAPSPATPKGRMKRLCTGVRSTRHKGQSPQQNDSEATWQEDVEKDYVQTEVVHAILIASEKASNIFCYAALADKQTGTIYTDCTGALPAMSLDGNQYYFVAYSYDNNYIFAVLIPDLKDDTIIKAFDGIFTELEEKRHKPTFNVTENQATAPLKAYLKSKDCKW